MLDFQSFRVCLSSSEERLDHWSVSLVCDVRFLCIFLGEQRGKKNGGVRYPAKIKAVSKEVF